MVVHMATPVQAMPSSQYLKLTEMRVHDEQPEPVPTTTGYNQKSSCLDHGTCVQPPTASAVRIDGTHQAAVERPPVSRCTEHRKIPWPAAYPSDDKPGAILLCWLLTKHRLAFDDSDTVSFVVTAPYDAAICLREMALDPTRGACNLLEDIKLGLRSHISPPAPSVTEFTLSDDGERSEDQGGKRNQIRVNISAEDVILTPEFSYQHTRSWLMQTSFMSLAALLGRFLEKPTARLDDLMRLTHDERETIWGWNRSVPPCLEECIHDIIIRQAREHPAKTAVVSWDGELSYEELLIDAQQLAEQLVRSGVTVGSVVPVCFEKSRWTVVAVMGVMLAGAAFTLMDPSQPEQRLATVAADVSAAVVLTSESKAELGRKIAPFAQILPVSSSFFESLRTVEGPSTDIQRLPPVPPSSNLYIQFTSGSTGRPKGVVISHANYTSGALPRAAAVGYTSSSRVLDFASYAFDVSIDCMLCTLATGGCICVPSDAQRLNDLVGAIDSMAVNMAHMTPSVARILDSSVLRSLDVLGLGGESVSAADVAEWSKLTSVIIAYGPSECTVGCTINNTPDQEKGYVSIGTGVGGVTWVTDPDNHNQLMPPGAVGELLIEGPIVGMGYLHEPAKSAEVFIEDPEWLVEGSVSSPGRRGRLYKTGDLVKYAPDGSGAIVFVGRKDSQVKLRGQRVELGEIEHHVRQSLPAGTQISAEIIQPNGGKTQAMLVVFVATGGSDSMKTETAGDLVITDYPVTVKEMISSINGNMSKYLPSYMVPAAYIPVESIPIMVSGKTNRKALRELGSRLTTQHLVSYGGTTYAERELTPEEQALRDVWAGVLCRDPASIQAEDDFFLLGGDSILAMKLVSAARKKGISLSVAQIFTNPRLCDLAVSEGPQTHVSSCDDEPFSLIRDQYSVADVMSECALLMGLDGSQIEDIYHCTPLQEGLVALSAKFQDSYVAQRVAELPGESEARLLQTAFEDVIKCTPVLRTRIVQTQIGGLVQVVTKQTPVWTYADDLDQYLKSDQQLEMGLTTPLVRFGLVAHRDSNKRYFVWTMHHAIYDGWSIPVLLDRLRKACQGLPIPPPVSFKSFIGYLSRASKASTESFWKAGLEGATDPQFPALPDEDYITRPDSLLEQYIPVDSQQVSGTTLATLIRGAWAVVAGRHSGTDDVVFGETLTGRSVPIPGVEEIDGPMITTVPVRVRVNAELTVRQYLSNIRAADVARIPHEHYGMQHIRRLSPDARVACNLRTGLVIHPPTKATPGGVNDLVDGLAPANDEDAAREALKFNSYALMLVCSLDESGILVMASFDSGVVKKTHMEWVLRHLSMAIREMSRNMDSKLGDVNLMPPEDLHQLWTWNAGAPLVRDPTTGRLTNPAGNPLPGSIHSNVTVSWITDPSDPHRLQILGAVGEHVIEGPLASNDSLKNPPWLTQGDGRDAPGRGGIVHRTGNLVRYNPDGQVVWVGRVGSATKQSSISIGTPPPEVQPTAVSKDLTEAQLSMRRLWADALALPSNGITLTDNFFSLGADSITAMKLVFASRRQGYKITVADLFRNKTLEKMSRLIEGQKPTVVDLVRKQHAPFTALQVPDIDVFVSSVVKPLLPCPTWEIKDILPTPVLQEGAVEASVKNPKFSMQYNLLYVDSSTDLKRLVDSCNELVAQHEILRTVFVRANNQCLQVILTHADVPTAEFDAGDDDLETRVEQVCRADSNEYLPYGSVFLKYLLVRGNAGTNCFILRISHAQYDGMCLSKLLLQLAQLYDGTPVPKHAQFSDYIYQVITDVVPNSYTYWRTLLSGATMSVLTPRTPTPKASRAISLQRSVSIASKTTDHTLSTVVLASWAYTLSRYLSTLDVTFGQVVAGRTIDLPDADTIIGKCDQHVPVRVPFSPLWTSSDLLLYIQDQKARTAPHEATGLAEITANCTDWSPQTVFDSVVHHHDIQYFDTMSFGGKDCRLGVCNPHEEPALEWKVQSWSDREGRLLHLEIICSESWRELGEEVLGCLAEAAGRLVRDPGAPVFALADGE